VRRMGAKMDGVATLFAGIRGATVAIGGGSRGENFAAAPSNGGRCPRREGWLSVGRAERRDEAFGLGRKSSMVAETREKGVRLWVRPKTNRLTNQIAELAYTLPNSSTYAWLGCIQLRCKESCLLYGNRLLPVLDLCPATMDGVKAR
jgi:hypothetical protein